MRGIGLEEVVVGLPVRPMFVVVKALHLLVVEKTTLTTEKKTKGCLMQSSKKSVAFSPETELRRLTNRKLHNFVLTLPNQVKCVLKISGGEAKLVETTWNPEFGKSVVSIGLVIAFTEDKIDFSISGYT